MEMNYVNEVEKNIQNKLSELAVLSTSWHSATGRSNTKKNCAVNIGTRTMNVPN